MPFKKRAARAPVPVSPEALYPTLSHGSDAPRELWSRQADVLRAYDRLKDKTGQFSADIAIELPTGAGKTLVGCLIAEWRRRKYEETVAYVAPTRQLAQQAAAKAGLYGIPAVDLTGSHTGWDTADEVSFRQGDAVAFVTYSSVFNANTNPYITAQTLVLDDAHAAEGMSPPTGASASAAVTGRSLSSWMFSRTPAQYPPMSSAGCGLMTSMTPRAKMSRPRSTWPGSRRPRPRSATWSRCLTMPLRRAASRVYRSSPWIWFAGACRRA